ncbi:hypothetical protein [Cryptosporidium hominis TU502]|uniref:hypothetical protein n=1 Tax=Cryptosporidium hominis (strain TU502) TaxID=353151 RepID=UPI0000452821|nr:hypothetical protein [Cryptosporidium hominis TU502]
MMNFHGTIYRELNENPQILVCIKLQTSKQKVVQIFMINMLMNLMGISQIQESQEIFLMNHLKEDHICMKIHNFLDIQLLIQTNNNVTHLPPQTYNQTQILQDSIPVLLLLHYQLLLMLTLVLSLAISYIHLEKLVLMQFIRLLSSDPILSEKSLPELVINLHQMQFMF